MRTFSPSSDEFLDPVTYIEKIAKLEDVQAAGGFKIKAPVSF